MIILALESATSYLSIALLNKNKLLEQIELDVFNHHEKNLIKIINNLLKKTQIEKKNINLICVDKGPGSFTSLRIGITTARAFAQFGKIDLVAIESLEILKVNLEKKINLLNSLTFVSIKSRKNYAYISIFIENKIFLKNVELNLTEFVNKINFWQGNFIGITLIDWEIELKKIFKKNLILIKDRNPHAEYLGQLAYKLFLKGIKINYENLTPKYLK